MTLTPTRQPDRIETPDVTELLIKEAREHVVDRPDLGHAFSPLPAVVAHGSRSRSC